MGIALAFSCRLSDNPDRFLKYVWSGGITDSSAVIAFKLDQEANVRVVLSVDDNFNEGVRYSDQTKVGNDYYFTSKLTIADLLPDTKYFYTLEIDGEITRDDDLTGTFKTFPWHPFSYTIAFASCARTGSASSIFNTIGELEPLFYMNTGDFHYEDIGDNCKYNFAEAFFANLRSPTQSELYKHIPFVYMWDDHDYGPNNSAEDANCAEYAVEAYQRLVPHYPLAFDHNDGPVSQAFNVGRIKFVLTDLRSQKVRPEYSGCEELKAGTNFGSKEHLAWFKEQLILAKRDSMVVAWISGIPWISDKRSKGYNCAENDDWGGFEEERQNIADFVKQYKVPIFILSGDAHMVAIDDGSNGNYATGGATSIPVFHAAPLDNSGSYKGGPYSHGYRAENGQFGMMKVIDHGGKQVCIEWKGLNKQGDVLVNAVGKELKYRFCMDVY